MTEALKLQRPLPEAALKVGAKGEKEDRVPEAAFARNPHQRGAATATYS
jgi:hypothetical protein